MPLAVYVSKDLCSCLYFLLQEESDSIERLHISASEAFTKFKGKTLDGKGIDFSDRLSKRLRTGYDARYRNEYTYTVTEQAHGNWAVRSVSLAAILLCLQKCIRKVFIVKM
jgi:hypothetical protein